MWACIHHMLLSQFLFAGAKSPYFTLLINPPIPPPSPFWTDPSPGGLLSTSHRQGVRWDCNWNTDYMNNEPETTRMARNRDRGLETIMNRHFWEETQALSSCRCRGKSSLQRSVVIAVIGHNQAVVLSCHQTKPLVPKNVQMWGYSAVLVLVFS